MKLTGAFVLALALAAAPAAIGARSTAEPEIEMEDFSYRPARKVVAPGALVVWKNRDRAPHNASSLARLANGTRFFRTRTVAFRGKGDRAGSPPGGDVPLPLHGAPQYAWHADRAL